MIARHLVLDEFLGADGAGQLLAFTLANEARYVPAEVKRDGNSTHNPAARDSFVLEGNRDGALAQLRTAILSRFDEICAATGIDSFPLGRVEMSLAVHREGGHFVPHVDTFAGKGREASDRVISLVYYFHRQPRGFAGGELVLLSPLDASEVVIDPAHDRLVAFPSFALHTVRRTEVPGNGFADARFTAVCWLHRQRPPRRESDSAPASAGDGDTRQS